MEEILKLKEEGNALFLKGELIGSKELYLKALDLCSNATVNMEEVPQYNDTKVKLFSNLAECEKRLNELEKAIEYCTKALEIAPLHEKSLFRRAISYESLKKYKMAIEDLQALLLFTRAQDSQKQIYKKINELMIALRIEEKHGCKHYARHCSKFASCCSKWYPCRHCHNENEDHEIDRYKIQKIKCNHCDTEQLVSNKCINCGIQFAHYFCSVCNLFDDSPEKNIFHCNECGLCRLGPKENFFHCNTCGCCLSISHKDNHKCLDQRSRQNCPVCLEDLHTSTNGYMPIKCGHFLHPKCFSNMIKNNSYKCPLCQKLMVDLDDEALDREIANTPMPEEYKDMIVKILCNECNEKSECNFHIFGMKCSKCGSYNTQRI